MLRAYFLVGCRYASSSFLSCVLVRLRNWTSSACFFSSSARRSPSVMNIVALSVYFISTVAQRALAQHAHRAAEGQRGVKQVLHPALPSFPGHDLWKRDFCGASGLFSIVLDGGGTQKAHAFLDALEIFGLGYSWGGHESLAVHVYLGDRTVSRSDYGGPLIRLQIGLEDVADLKADLSAALEAANAAG